MNAIRMQTNRTAKIVTSGYADRFLRFDTSVIVTVQNDEGITADCQFPSESDARMFLMVSGMSFDDAWEFSRSTKATFTMAGKIDHRRWQSMVITREHLNSIKAFLTIRNSSGYTQEHIDKQLARLNNHPIPESLLAIVCGQLAECDRKNTEMWGHPNGQAGQ